MEFVFNVCRACMVPNFHNNHLSIFDNNGKYAKELFFVAGLSYDDERVNFPALICDGCAMFLVKAYNFRQQCLKSQKYLSKFLYPFQYFPPQAIPNNLPDYFPKEPKVYPDKYNCSETEELKIQNTRDTTNDVGLKEEFSKDENLSIIDLTDESVDSSDVYLESDSGIGGRTPENIDSNTNDVKISLLKPISEQALELAQFAESSTLTDCKLPTTSYKHSENSTSFIVPLNKSRSFCNICMKSFRNRAVKAHITLVHSVRDFVCDLCGKRFNGKLNVQNHIELVHQEPIVKQLKETAANNQIEGHRRTRYFEQSPNIPSNFTICHICHLTCSSGNTLKAHMRINHCERNIACEFCEKKCMDKRGLTVHISKTHKKPPTRKQGNVLPIAINKKIIFHHETINVSRVFKCMICKKRCKSMKRLDKHMEKHTKEFECQHCPLKTHYLYSLKAHIRRNHSDMLDKKN